MTSSNHTSKPVSSKPRSGIASPRASANYTTGFRSPTNRNNGSSVKEDLAKV
jgi:hypothetical protein